MCLLSASRTSRTREKTGTSSYSCCRYSLTDILVIAVCAAIAGAESYQDIVLYGKSKTSWLAEFLDLEHGIPSHDTFLRVFSLIDAEAFEACFTEWAQSQAESGFDGEVS